MNSLGTQGLEGAKDRALEGVRQRNLIDAVSQAERHYIQLNSQISWSAVVPRSTWWLTVPKHCRHVREDEDCEKEKQHGKCGGVLLKIQSAWLTCD